MKAFSHGALVCLVVAMSGCAGTVTPSAVIAAQPGFDGKAQDSGVIEVIAGAGRVITPHWRDRYNDLVRTYGADPLFHPALKPDDGVVRDGRNFFVDAEHAIDFDLMNTWSKSRTHQAKGVAQKAGAP